uniref:Uncharacterized protein n=1 Tax=Amphora coffeiformis TaxID=265554 RepID=A0A7S3LFJ4_9STRA|mmetsp:Transcript_12001/g.23044  ORF Transcript_12001/g.23044 Transcript_12001/m.23044 type:complete len:445 (+) Transcript_12001:124-1458(+)
MNSNALAMLKAAAEKKKSNWKDPVVKQVKVTREQYLQEKAEEEAKKNKKKAFLMGNTGGGDVGVGAVGPDPRVTETLGQIQRERSQLVQEKQQWAAQLQEMKSQMQQFQSQVSMMGDAGPVPTSSSGASQVDPALRRDLDQALERLDAVEQENQKLRKQLEAAKVQVAEAKSTADAAKSTADSAKSMAKSAASGSSSGNNGGGSGVSEDDLDDLTERIEVLEEKHSKLILSTAQDSTTLEETKEDLQALQKRVGTLEKAAVAAAKRERSRARSTTRKAPVEESSPRPASKECVKTQTNTTPMSPPSQKKESAPPATIPNESSSSEKSREAPMRSKSSDTATPSDVLGPHTAQEVAHAQASDKGLVAYLEKSGGAGMYPKFSMSVKDVDGLKLVFFYKKLYVPESLREKTLRYYNKNHNDDGGWTRTLAKNVIWPSLDADVTTFK